MRIGCRCKQDSRKIISAKYNYKIYDKKLLAIEIVIKTTIDKNDGDSNERRWPGATSQQTHRVSTSDGTRKEGIGVEGLVRGGRPEGEERGRRGATVPLTPPKLLDNTDTK